MAYRFDQHKAKSKSKQQKAKKTPSVSDEFPMHTIDETDGTEGSTAQSAAAAAPATPPPTVEEIVASSTSNITSAAAAAKARRLGAAPDGQSLSLCTSLADGEHAPCLSPSSAACSRPHSDGSPAPPPATPTTIGGADAAQQPGHAGGRASEQITRAAGGGSPDFSPTNHDLLHTGSAAAREVPIRASSATFQATSPPPLAVADAAPDLSRAAPAASGAIAADLREMQPDPAAAPAGNPVGTGGPTVRISPNCAGPAASPITSPPPLAVADAAPDLSRAAPAASGAIAADLREMQPDPAAAPAGNPVGTGGPTVRISPNCAGPAASPITSPPPLAVADAAPDLSRAAPAADDATAADSDAPRPLDWFSPAAPFPTHGTNRGGTAGRAGQSQATTFNNYVQSAGTSASQPNRPKAVGFTFGFATTVSNPTTPASTSTAASSINGGAVGSTSRSSSSNARPPAHHSHRASEPRRQRAARLARKWGRLLHEAIPSANGGAALH